jgi:hypothetical protein
VNNRRREASRHFRNEKRKYLRDKTNEIATHNKKMNTRDLYRGLNELKKGYQPGTNTGR